MGRSVKARHVLAVGMSLILTGTASGKEAQPQKSGPRLGGTPGITGLCRLRAYPKPNRSLANQRPFFEGTRGSVAIRVDPGRWDEAAAGDVGGPRRSDPAEEPPRSTRCRVHSKDSARFPFVPPAVGPSLREWPPGRAATCRPGGRSRGHRGPWPGIPVIRHEPETENAGSVSVRASFPARRGRRRR